MQHVRLPREYCEQGVVGPGSAGPGACRGGAHRREPTKKRCDACSLASPIQSMRTVCVLPSRQGTPLWSGELPAEDSNYASE
eukprot:2511906-Pyramimonas_sp.AAC.1